MLGQTRLDDRLERIAQVDRRGVYFYPAGVELREVEQLLDQAAQALGLLIADLDQLLSGVRREAISLRERREDAVDGARRRSELARGDGDEVGLEGVERQCLLVQLPALDRKSETLGD